MMSKYILQFKDIHGNPLKYKEITAINYSNIFSVSNMNITNNKGEVSFWFFSIFSTIKIQTYLGYHKLPMTHVRPDKKRELIVPEDFIEA